MNNSDPNIKKPQYLSVSKFVSERWQCWSTKAILCPTLKSLSSIVPFKKQTFKHQCQ